MPGDTKMITRFDFDTCEAMASTRPEDAATLRRLHGEPCLRLLTVDEATIGDHRQDRRREHAILVSMIGYYPGD
jgi:hypothetical protein